MAFLENFLNKNLTFQYQPIFDSNNNIFCYEILSRIKFDNKLYYPISFLSAFKEDKHYLILKVLIKKNLEIIKKYNISKKFNINVNFFDLKHKGIVESIIENKDYFNVEFLENSLFDDYIDELCILKETGVTIFLDDFGSDKSITNYFNDIFFENIFSFIKLDKIFVKRVLENEKEYLKLKKIIDLFKLEDKKIVVEWIENEKIYDLFKALSIDYYQGFYLSKPLSLEDMLLNEQNEEIGSNRRVVLTNTAGKNVLLTYQDKYTCYAKPQQ